MEKQTLNIPGPWEFREFPETARRMSDLDEGRWLKTDQPQSIFLSLAQAGILTCEDVFTQPHMFKWVQHQSWVYRTRFLVPEELYAIGGRKELIFECLDTVTQIWLNGKLLGRTDNMFISHRFDASSLLRPGENSLVIQFLPARDYANKLMKRHGRTTGPSCPASTFLRKAQYQFGSVLGPSLVNCGIIGPVRLELTQHTKLMDIHLRTIDCNESFADIRAAIMIRPDEQNRSSDLRCLLRIQGQGPVLLHILDFRDQQESLSTVLRIERPILWQPKGFGNPFRYHIQAQLYDGDLLLDEKELFFGIRTIRMLRPQEGTIPLAIEINQQPIELKGLYWIPLQLLQESNHHEKKKFLLDKLADANVNTLCVWSDGGYENDIFYEWCDQLGILVWQELMYPAPPSSDRSWITGEYRHEMEQIVCRLRNHASVVGWCSGFSDWLRPNVSDKRKNTSPRETFHREMTEMLNEWDPDRDYVCAFLTEDISKNRSHSTQADNGVDAQNNLLASEQAPPSALPCLQTLQIACRHEDLFPGSAQIESQIYQPLPCFASGQSEILFAPPRTIEEQIYQSQVTQGRWIKKRIESVRGQINSQQRIMPCTAGQFWPGAGFSMMDFAQRPNALYYYIKRGFSPVMVCLTKKEQARQTGTSLHSTAAAIINDRAESLTGKIVFELLDMKGQILDTAQFPVFMGPYSKNTDIIPPRAFLNPLFREKSLLRLAVIADEHLVCENLYLYMPDKYVTFKTMELDLTVNPVSNKEVLLNIKSRYFVKDLEIVPSQNAYLGDNFLDILPGRDYTITAHFNEPLIRPDAPWIFRSACMM